MEDFDSSTKDTPEEEIQFSRKKQKELIHPYRKYQLLIILLIIIMLTFILILFSQKKEISIQLKQYELLKEQYQHNLEQLSKFKTFSDKLELNYKFYHLEQEIKIDIIKTMDEFKLLLNFVSVSKTVQNIFILCYKATKHGDNNLNNLIENCGDIENENRLILIETTDGYRFGAYISKYSKDIGKNNFFDSKAFIFSFDTKKKYNIKNPEFALRKNKDYFLSYGREDIFLGKNF